MLQNISDLSVEYVKKVWSLLKEDDEEAKAEPFHGENSNSEFFSIKDIEDQAKKAGVPSMAQGLPNGRCSDKVLTRFYDSLQNPKAHQYASPWGLPELRQFYARRTAPMMIGADRGAEKVVVVPGATFGTFAYFSHLHRTRPKAAVIVCAPSYGLTFRQLDMLDHPYVTWPLIQNEDRTWDLNMAGLLAAIKSCGEVGCVMFMEPHNPTGLTLSPEDVSTLIAAMPQTADLLVDETYSYMRDDLNIGLPAERTWLVGTMSKSCQASGWRVGFVSCPTTADAQMIRNSVDTMCACTSHPGQLFLSAVLKESGGHYALDPEKARGLYAPNYSAIAAAIENHPVFLPVAKEMPSIYFMFVQLRPEWKDREIDVVKALTREGVVATVPGCLFQFPGYLRFCIARDKDMVDHVVAGLRNFSPDRIDALVEEDKKMSPNAAQAN